MPVSCRGQAPDGVLIGPADTVDHGLDRGAGLGEPLAGHADLDADGFGERVHRLGEPPGPVEVTERAGADTGGKPVRGGGHRPGLAGHLGAALFESFVVDSKTVHGPSPLVMTAVHRTPTVPAVRGAVGPGTADSGVAPRPKPGPRTGHLCPVENRWSAHVDRASRQVLSGTGGGDPSLRVARTRPLSCFPPGWSPHGG